MEQPDPITIRDATDGDEASFDALVRPLEVPVWKFLVRMLGDPHLAEDVAQDTFVKVYLKLGSFRGTSQFSTWVFQIARNTAIDAIRKRDRAVRSVAPVDFEPATPAETWTVELDSCVAQLPPDLRETLLLIDVVGLSYAETADVLGVPIGTVKSRLHTARTTLTSWLRPTS